ncbi:MAG: hypothetical protein K0R31_1225 [Clostridiales bacterium]|nr:hypothetical protein [Clostridiales bacterium]
MLLNALNVKYKLKIVISLVLAFILTSLIIITNPGQILEVSNNDDFNQVLNNIFEIRNKAIISHDPKINESMYNMTDSYGAYSYKYEGKRIEYFKKWAEKQGIKFTKINSKIKITTANKMKSGSEFKFINTSEYEYSYLDNPDNTNLFRIVTYHYLLLTEKENEWKISKEWYLDPVEYSLDQKIIGAESIKKLILSKTSRNLSGINERRVKAVEYADKYSGASGIEEYGVMYNKKYYNYNGIGGDCTNYISQVLFEGGKFKKSSSWNYDGSGSSAWVRADAFLDYMLYSGRASLIASGPYEKVVEASYKLEPGDVISYKRGGRVEHTTIVTGADSKGYSLVNGHTVDNYRVPWDLGWNNKDVKFYLLKVHY